ncbi:MAG: STAS domain-containing protein [Fibrobacterota bacterium]
MSSVLQESIIVIDSSEKNGCYTVNVTGEMIGNSANDLVALVDRFILENHSAQLLLDLSRVTYISSYSFGIIVFLWEKAKESGKRIFIVANAAVAAKFDRLGFNNNKDLKILSLNTVTSPAFSH